MSQSESKKSVKEQDVVKVRAFVEKMGSLEKAKAAVESLQKIRKAA